MDSRYFQAIALAGVLLYGILPANAAVTEKTLPAIAFKESPGRLDIQIGERIVATYVYNDPAIPRPYFQDVKTLDGVAVTRPNPPDPAINKGNDDHPTFHPGLWLAFGDLSGKDFWRNKAAVRHVRFLEPFVEQPGLGRFTVENEYAGDDTTVVCRERCTYTIRCESPGAYFISSDSVFQSDTADSAFGDQEEMGAGIRLNTPLTVKFGSGKILNSAGGVNEKETWGRPAAWCGAVGVVEEKCVGVSLMPAPDNFRPSWFHTRDYGLIVANPFGTKSMTAPNEDGVPLDSTVVKKGTPFRFGWGVYVFGGPAGADPGFAGAYDRYRKFVEQK